MALGLSDPVAKSRAELLEAAEQFVPFLHVADVTSHVRL